MSTRTPEIIVASSVSEGWGRVFLRVIKDPPQLIPPILLSIGGFDGQGIVEDLVFRQAVDTTLQSHNKCSCDVSAMMIFPYKQWLWRGRPPHRDFFAWYLEQFLPRLKKRDHRNQNGTYFERMISFQGARCRDGKPEVEIKKQLEHIISIWRRDGDHGRRSRQSALQVSCFDPVKDQTGQPVRGFPCLQQVSFGYDDAGGLAIDAYYPTQYVVDRGYGNYLGLVQLGHFMAHEMGLKMVRMNCLIAHPELGDITKSALRELQKLADERYQ